MKPRSQKTSWGAVADWYDKLLENDDDSFQAQVIGPHLDRLVGAHKGMKLLDLACGQGFFSRRFAAAGADVVASDISPELISLARKNTKSGVTYYVAPADDASFIGDGVVDVVTIVLALQNIEHIERVFAEASRVLMSGGKLFFVLNHPAFRNPRKSDWGWDEESKTQYRRVDEYLSERKQRIEMHPGEKYSDVTYSYHRPLQLFVKLLTRSGFTISDFEEWISHRASTSGPRAGAENKARKEIPLFLCVGATKK